MPSARGSRRIEKEDAAYVLEVGRPGKDTHVVSRGKDFTLQGFTVDGKGCARAIS